MTKRRKRQQVDATEAAKQLKGSTASSSVVQTMAEEIAQQGAREDRESKRKSKLRPTEKRRRKRKLTVTFSQPQVPERVRALAEEWGIYVPNRGDPNVSAVIEYLLLPRLEAAERGEIAPPTV
jgi:hypothetical protein